MRRRVIIGIGAFVLAFGACGQGSGPSGNVGSGEAPGEAIEVDAEDNRFVPKTIRAEAGDELTVEIANVGDAAHDFAIPEIDLNTGPIGPGGVAHATFTVPEGSTGFVCNYHGGMKGEIVGR